MQGSFFIDVIAQIMLVAGIAMVAYGLFRSVKGK
jgi:hypothetical protein